MAAVPSCSSGAGGGRSSTRTPGGLVPELVVPPPPARPPQCCPVSQAESCPRAGEGACSHPGSLLFPQAQQPVMALGRTPRRLCPAVSSGQGERSHSDHVLPSAPSQRSRPGLGPCSGGTRCWPGGAGPPNQVAAPCPCSALGERQWERSYGSPGHWQDPSAGGSCLCLPAKKKEVPEGPPCLCRRRGPSHSAPTTPEDVRGAVSWSHHPSSVSRPAEGFPHAAPLGLQWSPHRVLWVCPLLCRPEARLTAMCLRCLRDGGDGGFLRKQSHSPSAPAACLGSPSAISVSQ